MSMQSDFAAYRAACLMWQRRLGLDDWRLTFTLDKTPNPRAFARVDFDAPARHADLVLFGRSSTAVPIARRALHEMLHLAWADLLKITAARASDMHADVLLEEHRLIERMMKALA